VPSPSADASGWERAGDVAHELQENQLSVDVVVDEDCQRMTTGYARLGRYQPESLLGQGRVTETLLARTVDPLPAVYGQTFALKVLRREPDCRELATRFIAAARTLQWMSLPGTASVVEIGEGPGPVFAAFEFKEGVDLCQLRSQAVPAGGQMDARLVGLIGRKLAERLGPLHAQPDGPRVHGGLSPGNVLVRPSGEVLLLDCGLAEALRSKQAMTEHWHYLAPEQLRGEAAGRAADLYALGALMYFLCYGRPPFETATPKELEVRIAQGPPAFDGLHPAVANSVARMLAYTAAARPKSAAEAARQISVALLSANAGGAFATPTPATAPLGPPPEIDIRPFVLVPPENAPALPQDATMAQDRVGISADDPDVGVVYDDDDEEDEIEVLPDGTVKRRRRRRAIRLLAWTTSAFARRIFRYAWVPGAVFLLAVVVEGFFFAQSWRAARAESQRRDQALAAVQARLEAARPKLVPAPVVPSGHLVLKVAPSGAVVWLDGIEKGTTPSTILTTPGAHRLVITAPGYRMLRDVVETTHGVLFEREMVPAVFPQTGSVGLNVACTTEGKYPVFVDGKEIGALCPIAGVRLDPGKHMVGVFVIPENRIWTLDREIVADRPHRVQFNY
jgi:serine/threonine-protein kinase